MPLDAPVQASTRGVRRFLLEAVDLSSAHRYEAGGKATPDQVWQEIRRLEAVIGRMNPLLDRDAGRLTVNLLHLERGVTPTPQLRAALRDALEGFARLHGASKLTIGRSRPAHLPR